MKTILITLGISILFVTQSFSELRAIVIVCEAVKEVNPTNITITGYTYTLKSDIKDENLTKVTLKELTSKLPQIKNSGSSVWVAIQSIDSIQSYDLAQIMTAMAENRSLSLIYLESGADGRDSGIRLLKNYNVGELTKPDQINKMQNKSEMATPRKPSD